MFFTNVALVSSGQLPRCRRFRIEKSLRLDEIISQPLIEYQSWHIETSSQDKTVETAISVSSKAIKDLSIIDGFELFHDFLFFTEENAIFIES